MTIDFDNNETYDLFMAAFDKALQLDTFENRGRVRQMFRDQMKQLAAAQARIAELEAQVAELVARAERNQGSADVLDEIEELMFGWEDDD